MTQAYISFLVIRVMIVVLSFEVAIRYGWWWIKVRRDHPEETLGPLLKGICIYHACVAGILGYFGFHTLNFDPSYRSIAIPLVLAFGACYGSYVNLIPCWRISYSASTKRIMLSVAARAVIAGLITFAFVKYRGF